MNESPHKNTRLARQVLYILLGKLPLDGSARTKEMESHCMDAITQTQMADDVVDKYYVDIRSFSGWIAAERGHEELAKFMEMFNEYRNSQ